MTYRQASLKTIQKMSIQVRRLAMKPFCVRALAATFPLFFVTSAVAEDTIPATNEYETPGPINAKDFLPKSAFVGKKFFVEGTVQNNGLQNTYRIRAGAEKHVATGNAATMQLLQELKAINQLRQISTTEAFSRGLTQSAKGPIKRANKLYGIRSVQ